MLTIVPTPIGNLEDITLRALTVLREADFVVAEDTRHSGILLKHFGIEKPLLSFHSHSTQAQLTHLLRLLRDSKRLALVSDAGMPGISDPGWLLISKAIEQKLPLTVLPGPSSVTTAVVASGLSCHRFVYLGYLPLKKGRKKMLEHAAGLPYTVVFFEAPHRLLKTLSQCADFFGAQRKIAVCRELTKLYEEVVRGTISEAAGHFAAHSPRGEFVLVVEGKTASG